MMPVMVKRRTALLMAATTALLTNALWMSLSWGLRDASDNALQPTAQIADGYGPTDKFSRREYFRRREDAYSRFGVDSIMLRATFICRVPRFINYLATDGYEAVVIPAAVLDLDMVGCLRREIASDQQLLFSLGDKPY